MKSLDILGEALARTFEKFAQEKVKFHDKNISFHKGLLDEFVDRQQDVGDIRISKGTGRDSIQDIGLTIYTDTHEGIMVFNAHNGETEKYGVDALSPHQIDENDDDNSLTLAAVATFLQTHFGYAHSAFFNDLSYHIDTIRSEIQLERKAQNVLDKLKL